MPGIPDRPHAVDYIAGLIEDFTPLAGDRKFSEDHALIAGIGRFRGQSVAILAQEKGHDTESRLKHNFGMVRPEGYRKAVRIMEMAERFDMPLVSFRGHVRCISGARRRRAWPVGSNRQVDGCGPRVSVAPVRCRRYR